MYTGTVEGRLVLGVSCTIKKIYELEEHTVQTVSQLRDWGSIRRYVWKKCHSRKPQRIQDLPIRTDWGSSCCFITPSIRREKLGNCLWDFDFLRVFRMIGENSGASDGCALNVSDEVEECIFPCLDSFAFFLTRDRSFAARISCAILSLSNIAQSNNENLFRSTRIGGFTSDLDLNFQLYEWR